MEYNVLNNGDLVLSPQSRYLPESIPHNRQNTKVVLLSVPYQGAGAPEAQYQSLLQDPYQNFAEVPYRSLQDAPYQSLSVSSHQALQARTFQAQTLQAQNLPEVSYQSFQAPSRRNPSLQAQNLPEASYQSFQTLSRQNPSLQAPSYSTFQSQSLPAPVHQSIEDMFSTSNTLTGSTAYAGNEMLVEQDTQQSEENFDIDMSAPVLPEAVEGMVTDTITPTLVETPPATVSRSCANCCSSMEELSSSCRRSIEELSSSCRSSIDELSSSYRKSIDELSSSYRSSIDELSSSQKRSGEKVDNMGRAWSRFAEEVTSDIDENKQWRISIKEKIEQLLEERAADGASDY